MVNDFSQNTNALHPSYEDEEYWQYLLEEAVWYEKQENTIGSFHKNEQDENPLGMDKNIH